jgi:hypothetical protein
MTSNGAAIATPIVVAVMLTVWIGGCFYANAHPQHKRHKLPRYEVSGGVFQARDGGRQLMPLPGERPLPTEQELATGATIPAPRAATSAAHAATSAAHAATAAAQHDAADEPHLVAGSTLR